ncbi:MAG TPA: MliC family protein [Casimicrobiaceae bacterium]|nr:MliC family protein [Casimicrobiaceae bacterium]
MSALRTFAVASALMVAQAAWAQSSPPADSRETESFVLRYRCDDGLAIAVAYPSYKDANREPIRLSFQGRRYVMHIARSGSGARYVTRNGRLEWWTKGNQGFLAVPGISPAVASGCVEF